MNVRPPIFIQDVKMQKLKTVKTIKFFAIDEFTGKRVKLTGKILGNHKAVKKQFPIECGEAQKGTFLVKVENRSGFYVISDYEILEANK